jgi:hypothetical protein
VGAGFVCNPPDFRRVRRCVNVRELDSMVSLHYRLLPKRLLPAILVLVSVMSCQLAFAQELNEATTSLSEPTTGPLIVSVTPDYTFVGRSTVADGTASGKSGVQTADLEIETEIPINSRWSVPVDFQSANMFLGSVAGIAIPEDINTIHLAAGLAYQFDPAWSVALTGGPALYEFDAVSIADVGIAGELRVTYVINSNLQFFLGADYEMDGKYPVLPVAGMKWKVNDHVLFDLRISRLEADYLANDNLSFFVDGNTDYQIFRAGSHLGNQIGMPSFNNAVGTYEDFHGGIGLRYQFNQALSLSAEAGYSFGRNIEYDRIDHHSIYFDPAPYAQVIAKWYF